MFLYVLAGRHQQSSMNVPQWGGGADGSCSSNGDDVGKRIVLDSE